MINFIDRQTLSVLAPILKREYRWTNSDFATVLISFRLAYTIMQSVSGRILDRLGTRRGLSLSVLFYSLVAVFTAAANGLTSFRVFRFLLGAGEAANWPGASKAVAEWFPAKERAWAVALFDSGSSIGGALAPFLVFSIYKAFGTWRPAVAIPGLLGGMWLLVWHAFYRRPEEHSSITREELAYIRGADNQAALPEHSSTIPWQQLFHYKQTWGIVLGRFLLDPFWFMMSEWFAVYLVAKGFSIEASVLGYWAPFLAADIGNFLGGGLSSMFIARGWSVGSARRVILWIFGPTMLILMAATLTSIYALLIIFFSIATLAYASCSTIFLSLPADVFKPEAVASVSGLGGTAAGLGTLISTYLIGVVADRGSFKPVIMSASIIPLIAVILMTTLVRSSDKPDPFRLLRQF